VAKVLSFGGVRGSDERRIANEKWSDASYSKLQNLE